jgi:hypothetical protein
LALAGAGRLALRRALGLACALRLALRCVVVLGPIFVAALFVFAGAGIASSRCRNGVTELAALVVVPAADDVEHRLRG